MGSYKLPPKVKLILGILGPEPDFLKTVLPKLAEKFGPEEEIMDPIPFIWTRYYAQELGETPWRSFVSYQDLIPRENLVDIKRWTNSLEEELSGGGPRRVNLDPGYMTLGQFFLATTKDQRHRVYVRDGIFVEPTLFFQDGAFLPFEWTYRDYRSDAYLAYFSAVRSKLAFQLRHGGMASGHRKKARKAETPGIDDAGSPAMRT
jgi:hypothetical protein